MREHLTASNGWKAIAIGIGAFEVACPRNETLSEGIDRAIDRHPLAKPAIAALGFITLAHLVNEIPEKYDPFHYALFWKHRDEQPGA